MTATTTLLLVSSLLTSIIDEVVHQSQQKVSVGKKRKRTQSRYCKTQDCEKWPRSGGLCRDHGGKRLQSKVCPVNGCEKYKISGGFCGEHGGKRRPSSYCKSHGCGKYAETGGMCMKHGGSQRPCNEYGCPNRSVINGVCVRHGAKTQRCYIDGCQNKSRINGACVRHGAVDPRCKFKDCSNKSVRNGVCWSHGAFPCITQGCVGNVYRNDPNRELCYNCFCVKYDYMPVNVKLREKFFHKLICKDFDNLQFSYNKSQPNDCQQTRYPDWSRDFGSFLLIVECDEQQHRGSSYSCENKRTVQIYQNAAHRPVVLIRFNPDCYTRNDGSKVKGCFKTVINKARTCKELKVDQKEVKRRWVEIKKQIKFYSDNLQNLPTKAITEHKLFYDGYTA